MTNGESFVNTKRWIEEVKNNCGDDGVPIVLVGNKCDMPNRIVSIEDQQEYAKLINLKFFETSAKDNKNVDEVSLELYKKKINSLKTFDEKFFYMYIKVFIELTRLILARQERNEQQNSAQVKTITVTSSSSKSSKSGAYKKSNCCKS